MQLSNIVFVKSAWVCWTAVCWAVKWKMVIYNFYTATRCEFSHLRLGNQEIFQGVICSWDFKKLKWRKQLRRDISCIPFRLPSFVIIVFSIDNAHAWFQLVLGVVFVSQSYQFTMISLNDTIISQNRVRACRSESLSRKFFLFGL